MLKWRIGILFVIVVFVFMLGISQHVGLILISLLSSFLSIYTNLPLANNFVGILKTSGFSPHFPLPFPLPTHTFLFIISVNENIMWRYIMLSDNIQLSSFVSGEPEVTDEHRLCQDGIIPREHVLIFLKLVVRGLRFSSPSIMWCI